MGTLFDSSPPNLAHTLIVALKRDIKWSASQSTWDSRSISKFHGDLVTQSVKSNGSGFQLLITCTAGIPVMGWAKSCSSPPPSPSPSPFPTTAFCSPHPYSPSKISLKGSRSVLLGVSGYLACEYSRLTLGVSWVSREKCLQFKPKNSLLMTSIYPEFRHCFRMATLLYFLYN